MSKKVYIQKMQKKRDGQIKKVKLVIYNVKRLLYTTDGKDEIPLKTISFITKRTLIQNIKYEQISRIQAKGGYLKWEKQLMLQL